MSRAIPLLPLRALGGLLKGDLYLTGERSLIISSYFISYTTAGALSTPF
jgi:hypothetical protein